MDDIQFLEFIGHTEADLEAANIEVAELRTIYDDHESRQAELRDLGETIQRALTRFAGVHSTRVRVKSSRSLIRKIVRKRRENPERNICFETYKNEVRDLIGLRALHLFEEDWRIVQTAIRDKWDFHPQEPPLAYLREGDNKALEEALVAEGFEVENKEGGYRSLHFIIKTQIDKNPCYAEIQVRTLFEEAWGEIDHQVRYPDYTDDKLLSEYLLILNRLAGGADEMASLLMRVKEELSILREANEQLNQEQIANEARIQSLRESNAKYVDQLDLHINEKEELKRRLDEVVENSINDAQPNIKMNSLIRAAYRMAQESGSSSTLPSGGVLMAMVKLNNEKLQKEKELANSQ